MKWSEKERNLNITCLDSWNCILKDIYQGFLFCLLKLDLRAQFPLYKTFVSNTSAEMSFKLLSPILHKHALEGCPQCIILTLFSPDNIVWDAPVWRNLLSNN